jgi:endo-alpha-1,4-polygalactosaminidase (GH114 family)
MKHLLILSIRTVFTFFIVIGFTLFSGCSQTTTDQGVMEFTMPTSNASVPQSSTDWWHPAPGLTWQWHLSDPPVDTSVDAQVYDIDLFDNDAPVIQELHNQGRKVICYISVGSWEDWRPDAGEFPAEVLGDDYDGWPGEKWLDIRRIDLLAPIMRARLDLCKARGFDGVEPDNIEIYDNDTGFPLTYQDQLNYARWLADEAHARGLAIGIKNAPDMVADSLSFFDFAITEDAFYYDWIGEMLPFIQAGKPIFAAEYTDMDVDFSAACAWGKQNNVNFILKNRILTAYRQTCP